MWVIYYMVRTTHSHGLETKEVGGSRLGRTCELALRRCANKRWVPCRDLDGMKRTHNQYKTTCGFRPHPRECLYARGSIVSLSIGPDYQYHIIIGGDMNVDFIRPSPNTCVLSDFITDLYTCIDLLNTNTNAPYTFINYNNSTSRIDNCLCQNHSVELWIIVPLLIIICFLIMFHWDWFYTLM